MSCVEARPLVLGIHLMRCWTCSCCGLLLALRHSELTICELRGVCHARLLTFRSQQSDPQWMRCGVEVVEASRHAKSCEDCGRSDALHIRGRRSESVGARLIVEEGQM